MKILKKVPIVLVLGFLLGLSGLIAYAATTPTLGTASTFGILANNLMRQGPQSKGITGDLGYTSLTGNGTSPTVSGTTYTPPSSIYAQAGVAQGTALTALNNQICTTNLATNVDLATANVGNGVGIYTPGVYCAPNSVHIGAAGITLSGNGTYIFKINGSLITAANSHVRLQNSASSCDVFWTTSISAAPSTFGGPSTFVGTLIGSGASSVIMSEQVTWTGRILVFGGGVAIASSDFISIPIGCNIPVDNLHVIKVVDNTYGGTAVPGDFNLHVKLAGVDVANSPKPGVAFPGRAYSLTPGTYVISEDPHAGYTATFSGDCTINGVTLQGNLSNSFFKDMVATTDPLIAIAGSGKTCTVTNHQTPPLGTLRVIKIVDNSYGGTAVPGNFNLHVKLAGVDVAGSPAAGAGSPGKTYSLAPNTYVVSEDSHAGYTSTYGGECDDTGKVVVPANAGLTCIVTNHQTPPADTLRVVKVVDNAYGGTAVPGDFNLHVKRLGVEVANSPAPGQSSPGKAYSLPADTYVVSEDLHSDYTVTYSGSCNGSGSVIVPLGPGKTTCIVTNRQKPPSTATLHVIKKFYNDYGGTAIPSDAMIHVKHNGVDVANSPQAGSATPGTSYTLSAGTYSVSENAFPGYTAIYGNDDCDFNGNITLAPGANKTCTISNDQIPPETATLHVIKHVINNNGGIATASSFNLHVKGAGAFGVTDVAGSPKPGVEAGRSYTLDSGTYVVSEDTFSGYTQSFSGDCDSSGNITLDPGANETCTITNDDNPPPFAYLRVIKMVINNDGGTATSANFNINVKLGGAQVNGSPANGSPAPGVLYTVAAGTYTVSEDAFSGYTQSFSSDCTDGTVTLALGDNKICTITNDDIAPPPIPGTLHVIKKVINNDGGTAIPSDFNLYVKIAGAFGPTNVTGSPAPGLGTPGRLYTLTAGNYIVSEDIHSGYSSSFSGDCDSSGNITLAAGGNGICTITNDDNKKPTPPFAFLHVIKTVINNDGGTATPVSFTLNVKLSGTQVAGSPAPGAPAPGTLYTLVAGTYVVSENTFSGYTQSFSSDCTGGTVTLVAGDDKTCMITNDDIAAPPDYATLNVIKHVINNNGGTAVASNFTMHVAGTNVSSSSFPGTETITTITLDAGAYSVTESGQSGYTQSNSSNCSGTIALGQTKTCTITNNDIAPPPIPGTLHVIKKVINNDGGTANPSDFNLYVKTAGSFGPINVTGSPMPGLGTPGRLYTLTAGNYVVSEDIHSGYSSSFSGDCDSSGNITLAAGGNGICTITNDDNKKPTPPFAFLHVIKTVINNDGGTATPVSFTLNVKLSGTQVAGSPAPGAPTPGTLYTLVAGTYVVSENTFSGYTQSFSSDCTGGTVTLVAGDDKTCMITNDDVAVQHPDYATLNVIKHVINNNGGTAVASNFTMHVAGTNVSSSSFPGTETITTITLDAGAYSVTESGQSGYTQSNSINCSGTIALGQTKTCTITNNDIAGVFIPGTLHVIKKVINNDGGTAIPSDFNLYVKLSGTNVTGSPAVGLGTPGRLYTLTAGNYVVSEDIHSGYSSSFSGDCDSSGNIILASGGSKTCTITNDDNKKPTPPFAYLHVIKTVINNDGGIATPVSFTLNVKLSGTQVAGSPAPGAPAPGTLYTLVAGTYVVSENTFSGYTQSFSSDCTGGTVTLVAGDDKTCMITNDDIAAPPHNPPYNPPYNPPPYNPPSNPPPSNPPSDINSTSNPPTNTNSTSNTSSSSNSSLSIPKLPNTGVAPYEVSIPWDIVTLGGIFTVSFVLYLVKRKKTI